MHRYFHNIAKKERNGCTKFLILLCMRIASSNQKVKENKIKKLALIIINSFSLWNLNQHKKSASNLNLSPNFYSFSFFLKMMNSFNILFGSKSLFLARYEIFVTLTISKRDFQHKILLLIKEKQWTCQEDLWL